MRRRRAARIHSRFQRTSASIVTLPGSSRSDARQAKRLQRDVVVMTITLVGSGTAERPGNDVIVHLQVTTTVSWELLATGLCCAAGARSRPLRELQTSLGSDQAAR